MSEIGYLTAHEAAVLLGTTDAHIAHLCAAGTLPAKRFGHAWAIPRSSVVRYARSLDPRDGGRPRSQVGTLPLNPREDPRKESGAEK